MTSLGDPQHRGLFGVSGIEQVAMLQLRREGSWARVSLGMTVPSRFLGYAEKLAVALTLQPHFVIPWRATVEVDAQGGTFEVTITLLVREREHGGPIQVAAHHPIDIREVACADHEYLAAWARDCWLAALAHELDENIPGARDPHQGGPPGEPR